MDSLLPEEKEAFDLLNNMGLKAKPVPTGKRKSPEFIVDGDSRGYVVEVKARRDSEDWKKLLRKGDTALEADPSVLGDGLMMLLEMRLNS
ncbi:MAG: hypothetical protein ACUZ8E_15995 [Candidatus Anammoxibacter sp.]